MRNTMWKSVTGSFLAAALTLLTPGPSQAADGKFNEKIPVNVTVVNPCKTGEKVQLSGDLHVVLQSKTNGDNTTVSGHINAQGIKGEGTSSGLKYVASGTGKISATSLQAPADATVSGKFRLTSQGSSDNLSGTATLKIHVNANGTFTVAVQAIDLECK